MNKIIKTVKLFILGFLLSLFPSCIDSHELYRYIHPNYIFTLHRFDIDGRCYYHLGVDSFGEGKRGSEAITGIAIDGTSLYLKKGTSEYACIKMDSTTGRTCEGRYKDVNDIFDECRIDELPPFVKLEDPNVIFDSLPRRETDVR